MSKFLTQRVVEKSQVLCLGARFGLIETRWRREGVGGRVVESVGWLEAPWKVSASPRFLKKS